MTDTPDKTEKTIRLVVSIYPGDLETIEMVNKSMGFDGNNSRALRHIIREYEKKVLSQPMLFGAAA